MYIVGSTNTGKSSLFNRLLLSDFCKSDVRGSIHRATVSFWPGIFGLFCVKYQILGLSYVNPHCTRSIYDYFGDVLKYVSS